MITKEIITMFTTKNRQQRGNPLHRLRYNTVAQHLLNEAQEHPALKVVLRKCAREKNKLGKTPLQHARKKAEGSTYITTDLLQTMKDTEQL